MTVVVVVLVVAFDVDFVVVLVDATLAEVSVVVLAAAFVVVIRSSSCTVYCGAAFSASGGSRLPQPCMAHGCALVPEVLHFSVPRSKSGATETS